MHYYQFNIGDYASHTSHLDELEDLAYRRMIDYCYLNEIGLPESVEEIARVIRMRTHSDRIANVLREFFQQDESGWWKCNRVEKEIALFREKSDKATKAARKRWENTDANALPTDSERNAKHKPLTINQEPDKDYMQKPSVPACPVEQIIQLYKDTASRLPSVRLVPDSTKAHIRARWLQDKRFQSLEFWRGFFEYCENNKFLSGQSETRGDRKPFRASLAWVVNASNFAKIINEDYA
jgi:uncharacterized protein YdaU (DUF1376 family)